jgi:hypothetical protein
MDRNRDLGQGLEKAAEGEEKRSENQCLYLFCGGQPGGYPGWQK